MCVVAGNIISALSSGPLKSVRLNERVQSKSTIQLLAIDTNAHV